MNHLEKVEKLRKKANVTYEEAKAALEACDWDILDAVIRLEAEGKLKTERPEEAQDAAFSHATSQTPGRQKSASKADDPSATHPESAAVFTTESAGKNTYEEYTYGEQDRKPAGFFTRLCDLIKFLVKAGCDNGLIVRHKGQQVMDIPIIAVVILLMGFFWIIVPLMVLSLFFDFNYNFSGPNLGKDKVNQTMNRAATAVHNFKDEMHKDSKASQEADTEVDPAETKQ